MNPFRECECHAIRYQKFVPQMQEGEGCILSYVAKEMESVQSTEYIFIYKSALASWIAMDGVMMMILCCCCWRREAIFHLLSFALQIVVTHFAHAPNGTLFIETKGRMTCQLNNTRKLCIVMHLAKSEWAWLLRVSWGEGMGDGDYIPRQSAS